MTVQLSIIVFLNRLKSFTNFGVIHNYILLFLLYLTFSIHHLSPKYNTRAPSKNPQPHNTPKVLVGTPVFNALDCSMGAIWDLQFETRDADIAVDNPLLPLVTGNPDLDLVQAIKDAGMGFVSIPMLNPKNPSTRFKMAGGGYVVELLTPDRGKPSKGPILISAFNAAAEPLRFLDCLLEEVQPAALPFGVVIPVNVPDPARFALHKLVESQRRPSAFAAKSKKDIDQARQMLEPGRLLKKWAVNS
jgi:hypothetical protein